MASDVANMPAQARVACDGDEVEEEVDVEPDCSEHGIPLVWKQRRRFAFEDLVPGVRYSLPCSSPFIS